MRNQEIKAIKIALELLGYYDVAESEDTIQEWLADDTISICHCCMDYYRLQRGMCIC